MSAFQWLVVGVCPFLNALDVFAMAFTAYQVSDKFALNGAQLGMLLSAGSMKAINPTQELSDLGVSIWLDDLNRESIESGGLHKFIDEMNVVGVTTNPTIFAAAVAGSHAYNGQLMTLAEAGASPAAAVVELTTDDVAKACDILKPIYKKSNGFDGRVSIEVNPSLAYDILATVEQAKALYKKVDRENMMVKIPATAEGLEAITVLTAAGISI